MGETTLTIIEIFLRQTLGSADRADWKHAVQVYGNVCKELGIGKEVSDKVIRSLRGVNVDKWRRAACLQLLMS